MRRLGFSRTAMLLAILQLLHAPGAPPPPRSPPSLPQPPSAPRSVVNAEHYIRSSILALLDQNKADAEKQEAVKAAFGENLIDINNGDHAETVAKDLNSKVIGRFLSSSEPSYTADV